MSNGVYPDVTLAQVRAKKDEARALLANGHDPSEAKKVRRLQDRARRGNTFEAMAFDDIAKAAAEGRAPATQTKTEWLLGMAIASFGKKPVTEVTAPFIRACLRKVEAKGNFETARRLRARIGAMFKFATANGIAETGPTYALQGALVRPQSTPRAAITDPKALGGLLRAIDGFQGRTVTRLALTLLMIPSRAGVCCSCTAGMNDSRVPQYLDTLGNQAVWQASSHVRKHEHRQSPERLTEL